MTYPPPFFLAARTLVVLCVCVFVRLQTSFYQHELNLTFGDNKKGISPKKEGEDRPLGVVQKRR